MLYMEKRRDYLIHPQFIVLYLLLASLSFLFLGFSIAYLYNRVQNGLPPIKLPTLFYFNTLILIGTTYLLRLTKQSYLDDNTSKYQMLLWSILMLTVLFLVLQICAWLELQSNNVYLAGSNMGTYLYVVSGLHFAHVVGGLPFLIYFIHVANSRMKEPVSVLIYFSDPDKKRGLDLLTIYWKFLDYLWIYLVLFFLINYLFK
jgi:cytochrome c oxidase subunit 3